MFDIYNLVSQKQSSDDFRYWGWGTVGNFRAAGVSRVSRDVLLLVE